VPGIGKRTAERIIVELRGKVESKDGARAGTGAPLAAREDRGNRPWVLARDGLLELGYAPGEAEKLMRDAEGDSAEELIAHALRLARAASG
jgi:Holliday junction DNA helicase RuvA